MDLIPKTFFFNNFLLKNKTYFSCEYPRFTFDSFTVSTTILLLLGDEVLKLVEPSFDVGTSKESLQNCFTNTFILK